MIELDHLFDQIHIDNRLLAISDDIKTISVMITFTSNQNSNEIHEMQLFSCRIAETMGRIII